MSRKDKGDPSEPKDLDEVRHVETQAVDFGSRLHELIQAGLDISTPSTTRVSRAGTDRSPARVSPNVQTRGHEQHGGLILYPDLPTYQESDERLGRREATRSRSSSNSTQFTPDRRQVVMGETSRPRQGHHPQQPTNQVLSQNLEGILPRTGTIGGATASRDSLKIASPLQRPRQPSNQELSSRLRNLLPRSSLEEHNPTSTVDREWQQATASERTAMVYSRLMQLETRLVVKFLQLEPQVLTRALNLTLETPVVYSRREAVRAILRGFFEGFFVRWLRSELSIARFVCQQCKVEFDTLDSDRQRHLPSLGIVERMRSLIRLENFNVPIQWNQAIEIADRVCDRYWDVYRGWEQ